VEAPEIYIIKDKIEKLEGKKFIEFLTSFAKLDGNFKVAKGNKWEEVSLEDFDKRFSTDEDATYLWSLMISEGPLKGYGGGGAISINLNRKHKVYLSFYIDVRSLSDGAFFVNRARYLIKTFNPVYLYFDIGVSILLDRDGFIFSGLPWLVYVKDFKKFDELFKRIIGRQLTNADWDIIKGNATLMEQNNSNGIFICFDQTLDRDENRRKILGYVQK
jgi:hypothetical protein